MIETVKKYIYFVEWKTFVVSFWIIVAIIYQNVKMAILISDVNVHCTTCKNTVKQNKKIKKNRESQLTCTIGTS